MSLYWTSTTPSAATLTKLIPIDSNLFTEHGQEMLEAWKKNPKDGRIISATTDGPDDCALFSATVDSTTVTYRYRNADSWLCITTALPEHLKFVSSL